MAITITKRPRNVGVAQAAAILYGDWGTSKAYVIGLAFAIAGYSSFWLILAVCVLNAMVALNYILICKFSPHGGGVYTSAKKRSEVLALIGGFFLVADYLITAALSAMSCFSYLQVPYPVMWSMFAILAIGGLNYFGPRHTGNAALIIALLTFGAVLVLGFLSIPYIGDAVTHLEPPHGGVFKNWEIFVGIIVALSGIEAIANQTGVMKLDPGTTEKDPSVHKTSKKAILIVMIEVCFFTGFFGFMINAIPDLKLMNGEVFAPDDPGIRDYMLKYMGNYFVTHFWGSELAGYFFGFFISTVFAILLLSAVNTAIVSLNSLLYVMSKDGQLPEIFQKMTPFGVPRYPLIIATLAPIVVLIFLHDVAGLANLYAVGFVGAIAMNLGVTATDKKLSMSRPERYFMFTTFIVMASIELTLFFTKPEARRFAFAVLTLGLILRALVLEHRQRAWANKKINQKHATMFKEDELKPVHYGAMLCVVNKIGKTLDFALNEAKKMEQPLNILFIKEQKVVSEEDHMRSWLDDENACNLFDYAQESSHEMDLKFFYAITDMASGTIVQTANDLKVSRLIIGKPRHSPIIQLLRGNIVQEVSEKLPDEIDLVIIS
jgi:amino acid transporter